MKGKEEKVKEDENNQWQAMLMAYFVYFIKEGKGEIRGASLPRNTTTWIDVGPSLFRGRRFIARWHKATGFITRLEDQKESKESRRQEGSNSWVRLSLKAFVQLFVVIEGGNGEEESSWEDHQTAYRPIVFAMAGDALTD